MGMIQMLYIYWAFISIIIIASTPPQLTGIRSQRLGPLLLDPRGVAPRAPTLALASPRGLGRKSSPNYSPHHHPVSKILLNA